MAYKSYTILTGTVDGVSNCGVGIGDIGKAVNSASTDLGTLCTSDNISKWSIYKPMRFAQVGPITYQQRRNADWGLTFAYTDGVSGQADSGGSLAKIAYNAMNPSGSPEYSSTLENTYGHWEYAKPAGGANTPYRETDFAVIPTDGTDPQYGNTTQYGYCSISGKPISVTIENCGTSDTDPIRKLDEGIYEVNVAEATQVTFTFANAPLDSRNNLTLGTIANGFRPIVQLFAIKEQAGNPWKYWYDFNPVTLSGAPSIGAIGSVINSETTSTSVTFYSLSAQNNRAPFYYAICGFVKCNSSGVISAQSKYMFLIPYSDGERVDKYSRQFIRELHFVTHSTRYIRLQMVSCYLSTLTWMIGLGGLWYLNPDGGTKSGTLQIALTMSGGSIRYTFVGNITASSASSSYFSANSRYPFQLCLIPRDEAFADSTKTETQNINAYLVNHSSYILTPVQMSANKTWSSSDPIDFTNTNTDEFSGEFYAQGAARPGTTAQSGEIVYYHLYMRVMSSSASSWDGFDWSIVNTVYVWNKNYPY